MGSHSPQNQRQNESNIADLARLERFRSYTAGNPLGRALVDALMDPVAREKRQEKLKAIGERYHAGETIIANVTPFDFELFQRETIAARVTQQGNSILVEPLYQDYQIAAKTLNPTDIRFILPLEEQDFGAYSAEIKQAQELAKIRQRNILANQSTIDQYRGTFVYLGTLEDGPSSSIILPIESYLDKDPSRLEDIISLISSREYRASRKVICGLLHHGCKAAVRLTLKTDEIFGTSTIYANISESSNQEFLVEPIDPKTKKPIAKKSILNFRLVTDFQPILDDLPLDQYDNQIVLVSEKKLAELEQIVQQMYSRRIEDISLVRVNKNRVYSLALTGGAKLMLKEFAQGKRHNLAREYFFSQLLAKKGFAPQVRATDSLLFSEDVGSKTLGEVTNESDLAQIYDAAIDALVALEGLRKSHLPQIRALALPKIDQKYFLSKADSDVSKVVSTNMTLIHENLYPGHIIIGGEKEKPKILDCEHICIGPAEWGLARLLINTDHELDRAFIRNRLIYYLTRHPEINQAGFYKSFDFYVEIAKKRIGKILDDAKKRSLFNSDYVDSVQKEFKAR